jgi:O-antigen ligase
VRSRLQQGLAGGGGPRQPGTAAPEKPATAAPPADPVWAAHLHNPLRKLAFGCAIVYIFLRISLLHELIAFKLDIATRVLYVVGTPALLGAFFTGGIGRTMRSRVAWAWLAFTIWMSLCVFSSSWRGGSTTTVLTWLRSEFSPLFLLAGLVLTWRELRLLFAAIAVGMGVVLWTASGFSRLAGGRFALDYAGSIANPNDLAAHLLMASGILLYFVLRPNQKLAIRLLGLGMIAMTLSIVVNTGSRGAVVAIGAMLVTYALVGPRRWVVIAAGMVLMTVAFLFSTGAGRQRLLTAVSNDQPADIEAEAAGSQEDRIFLLKEGVRITLQHPVFGVGPGEFTDAEGARRLAAGIPGLWLVSHNSFTEVSSETGLPGIAFYLGAIVGTFVLLERIRRHARQDPRHAFIVSAAVSLQLSLVTFGTAAFFLTLGYRFYFPVISGLAIALYGAYRNDILVASGPATPAGARKGAMGSAAMRRL